MSAIGRSRRSKNRAQQPRGDIPPELHVVPAPAPESSEHCDCAVCSGQVSPEQMLDELLAQGTELLRAEDPLDAEMLAAMLLAASPDPVEEFTAVVATDVVPALASVERTAALALLLAIGAVLPEPAGSAAATAARHLAAAGVPEPAWASELDEPVVAGDCWELTDPFGTGAVLACEFRRGSRSHGAVATVDNLNCGAADQLSLLDGGELAGALRELVEESAAEGLALEMTRVEPATSRWKLQAALDARAVHDQEDTGLDIDLEDIQGVEVIDNDVDDFFDEDGAPSYALLASLLRARITTLPKPTEAPPPHRAGNGAEALPPRCSGSSEGSPAEPAVRHCPPSGRRRKDRPPSISSRWDSGARNHRSGVGWKSPPTSAWRSCTS